ncbi:MAG: quinone-dependent dihydroorotate dehydrogenase [Gammaproteobacteria bacterium]|nr:quinone-dependent dihydroorotate dehydrogenase [Gammaproteobacteria bacterium]
MLYPLIKPVLFRLDAERAHQLTLKSLDLLQGLGLAGCLAKAKVEDSVEVMGIRFPNRVGLAAGLDKNGEHILGLAALGFGFVEIGTVTPRPQPGNPKPRLFRVVEGEGIINRMGFNNLGVDYLLEQVKRTPFDGVLGINIGKNFDTPIEKATDDYLIGLEKSYDLASYITINISSPNTKNLRQLQQGDEMQLLLSSLKNRQQQLAAERGRYVPLVVKIAPDLDHEQIKTIARLLKENGIDGVIATNTTIGREGVEGMKNANETGGLSGAPLTHKSTEVVRALKAELGEALPIIAAGGIMCGADAVAKIEAGAKLVQVYSGLIYRGPALVNDVASALAKMR